MAKLTLADARNTMSRGRPWTFRLEYSGLTDAGNPSHKFWLAAGRGRNEPVEIHHGKVGGKPQILVKDWAFVEAKTPEKEAKGYRYVDTPFVRCQQSTIDAFVASQGTPKVTTCTKPTGLPLTVSSQPSGLHPPVLMTNQPAPRTMPKPVPPMTNQATPTAWRCSSGGLAMRIKGSVIEVEFDLFPASWQGAVYGTFKDELETYCTNRMGRPISVWWGGDHSELFHVRCTKRMLFRELVAWFRQKIGVGATPLLPPPKLSGPFAKVVRVRVGARGIWHALDGMGDKVLDLTAKGARDLVAEYPHIQVAGL